MQIRIGDFAYSEVWDGVFYKKLSSYPLLSDWEMRTLIEFIEYEKAHGRDCELSCADALLLSRIEEGLRNKAIYLAAERPAKITECTACPYRRGCETEFVCHTTSVENAVSILRSGTLLSAVRARGVSAELLARESRNAAKDPPDYFDYIMFSWGNCQAGDRLVIERSLGHFPNEEELSLRFRPGIRFFFRYDRLKQHPNAVFDGVLPMKVKDALLLSDWVFRIVIPATERHALEEHVPPELRDRVRYIENDCRDIWEWSEKVYRSIESE